MLFFHVRIIVIPTHPATIDIRTRDTLNAENTEMKK